MKTKSIGKPFVKNTYQTFYFSMLCLALILLAKTAFAQSPLHTSVMLNYDLLEQKGPGYDLTLLYKGIWGVRYTLIEDLTFLDAVEGSNESVNSYTFQGDLMLPMVIKTIDYKSFAPSSSKIFDFLTAYVGFGYNNLDLELTLNQYTARESSLEKTTVQELVKSSVSAVVFGIYGGERFLVIDTRLLYVKGKTDTSESLDDRYEHDNIMLLISLGFGF